jgi:hypothetical protein
MSLASLEGARTKGAFFRPGILFCDTVWVDQMICSPEDTLVAELVQYFVQEGFVVHGARGVEGYDTPPVVRNDGFGSARPCCPDVVGHDGLHRRIVFGLVRPDRQSLDSEESLEQYNVLLDHNAGLGEQASVLYVLIPQGLLEEFTSIITHYVHREYWHRVIPVASGLVAG